MKELRQYLRDLWKRKDLLLYLVTSGLKADTRNTFLGYFWWLLDPLLMVLTFAFLRVVFLGRTGEHLIAFLAVGLVVFRHFSQNLTNGSKSITGQAGVITQVYLPKAMFPFGVVLTQLVNFVRPVSSAISPTCSIFGLLGSQRVSMVPETLTSSVCTSGTSSIGQMAPGAALSASIVSNTALVMSCPLATRFASARETAARL